MITIHYKEVPKLKAKVKEGFEKLWPETQKVLDTETVKVLTALYAAGDWVYTRMLADATGISRRYITAVLRALAAAGLVKREKGYILVGGKKGFRIRVTWNKLTDKGVEFTRTLLELCKQLK